MPSRLATIVAFALSLVSGTNALVNCGVCAKSIVYAGQTRTLSLGETENPGNYLQCNYDTPAIQGFNPYCVYQNVNGAFVFTNTGSGTGACPSITLLQKTSC
ncbi:hypothetical protein FB45DRAFT_932003 [Roridomyces roridus]|uniref:Uncharacterized protein n=1 Tax=Roridomyces roridus TaxID=1738132 RepID=A0AAD7BE51_9AGAR|nr:hypothetical protein FB45DRAFT_932003 [Roridomyces roridus]